MALNVQLISIDPQKDFTNPNGALFVPGGDENAKRTGKMIKRLATKLNDIHITMDSHSIVDIAHPIWFVDENGNAPNPFTIITANDLETGTWRTRQRNAAARTLKYVKALETSGRYPHCIWPEHCIIGTWGHTLNDDFIDGVHTWERTRYATANIVTKGSNPYTEHFSAVRAEVPDPQDPSTQLNTGLIQVFETADMLLWTGEALSHCLANTFRDTVAAFSSPDLIKKMWLLTDTTSNVQGFEHFGDAFIKEMVAKGMNLSTSVDILA